MESTPFSRTKRFKQIVGQRDFWILAALLVFLTFLHYLSPQLRPLPLTSYILERHTVERIVFLLPIASATFAFRQTGGLITLALAVLIMLPRVFLVSLEPGDALVETAAVALVGYFVVWMIETQEKEKDLRQKAVLRLRAINAVASILTESLELGQVLSSALDKVLQVTGLQAGLIFLLDRQSQELVLNTYRGVSETSAAGLDRLQLGEGFSGQVAQSGELIVVADASQDPRMTRIAVQQEGLHALAAVPLKSKGEVQGVLTIGTRCLHTFLPEELDLLTAIGNEIGVAIENARLYESLRFYVQNITRAQEEERKRIARELHDDTIQAMIALSRHLDTLASSNAGGEQEIPQSALRRIEELRDQTDRVIEGMRRFSRDLRPSILDDLGLLPALESLTTTMTERDGIQTQLQVVGEKRRFSPEVELTLFRITQEALSNVRKHAQATQAAVTVEFTDSAVQMTIQDNGVGFIPPALTGDLAATGKLGLVGMQERVRLLQGTLAVESQPGVGAKVTVNAPT
jgi:signal transduction histidine kinase